jgi:hypothetical protein
MDRKRKRSASTKTIRRKSPRDAKDQSSEPAVSANARCAQGEPISQSRPTLSASEADAETRLTEIVIRDQSGSEIRLPNNDKFKRIAYLWAYILRNRRRWAGEAEVAKELSQRIDDEVAKLPIDQEQINKIIESRVVEVGIGYSGDNNGWEARILPWEYVLDSVRRARASKDSKTLKHGPLTVIRYLRKQDSGEKKPERIAGPLRLLVVESAPGEVDDEFDFEPERKLVISSLGGDTTETPPNAPAEGNTVPPVDWKLLHNPTLDELEAGVQRFQPDVIHLAGVDNHQASGIVRDLSDVTQSDGMLLADEGGLPRPVSAVNLAKSLNAGAVRPLLVTCNFWNSAARVASSIVAHGSEAAIGFQDEIDDGVAENFFASFFRAWRKCNQDTPSAFGRALRAARNLPEGLGGAGVVLWLARPLAVEATSDEEPHATTQSLPARREILFGGTAGRTPHELLEVSVLPLREFNYSLLHNNQGLFKSFIIRVKDPDILEEGTFVRDVRIEATLHVGADSFPCRLTCELDRKRNDLEPRIRMALTSSMPRRLRESVRTSLYLRVRWKDIEIYRDTRAVTLLPVDEWIDEQKKTNRNWLPSFVLPRDPAVLRIVDSAQRYLTTLLDDSVAGFDGYQSVIDAETCDAPFHAVDVQVKSIWAALLYDHPLSYINPPPVYSKSSQRLRTPSDVLAGRRGTCIDLALLLASCLEYVDIYPVVFLLRGHAFLGYWRDSDYYDQFRQMKSTAADVGEQSAQDEGARGNTMDWVLDDSSYAEVLGLVQTGHLVPVESTMLTARGSFRDAVEQGMNNLASRQEFDSMVDIIGARRNASPVTPLPLDWGAS